MVKKVKKAPEEKRDVKQNDGHASIEVNAATYSFTNILHGMTVSEIIEKAQLIQDECGPTATVEVTYDNYFGSSADLTWSRLETDEEVAKRLVRAEKAKVTAKETRAAGRKQKKIDELAMLVDLQKKYPDGK